MNYINILLSSSDFLFLVSEDKYTFARILQNDSLIFDSHFEVIISLCKLVWTLINSFKLSCWRCFVLSGVRVAIVGYLPLFGLREIYVGAFVEIGFYLILMPLMQSGDSTEHVQEQ